MPSAEINGQHLHYEDTGDDGPAVVFSHGLFMDTTMFAPQVAALRGRYRVITWDERGHGETTGPDEPFTYWDSARDVLGLLQYLGIERAVFGGMSQGGFLSLRAALLAPEAVEALVLIDTQAGTENPEALPYYRQLLARWNEQGMDDELAEIIATIILGPGWDGAATWKAKWHELRSEDVNRVFETLVEREDIHDRLPEIAVPALVVHGESDTAIPIAVGERLVAGLPDAELHRVPGAGHASNLTHPDDVTPAIEAFLDRVTAQTDGAT